MAAPGGAAWTTTPMKHQSHGCETGLGGAPACAVNFAGGPLLATHLRAGWKLCHLFSGFSPPQWHELVQLHPVQQCSQLSPHSCRLFRNHHHLLLAPLHPSNPPYTLPPTSHSTYTRWHVFVYLFRVSSAHKRLCVPPQEGIICKMKMCLNMSWCELRVAKVLLSVWPGKPTHGDPLSPAPFKKPSS